MRPRLHARPLPDEPCEQMTARESGRAGDEGKGSHQAVSGAVAVLRLVILAELRVAVLDRPPPPLVLLVPGDGVGEPLLEAVLRPPPEGLELRRVERIPPVVAGPVRDGRDQGRRLAAELQEAMREVQVLDLVAAADIVDLAGLPLVDQLIDA